MRSLKRFKRGKSTFINALLGDEIVPTAIVPLTSVVTILRFGKTAQGVVHYLDVDAGIFVVTADPPLGHSEHQFLKDVRAYVDKLFFVLNKIDTVDERDLNEAAAFTADILTRDLARPVELWPISAKIALDGKLNDNSEKLQRSRLPVFEDHLRRFLHHEKGRVFLDAIISALLRHVADESMAYKLEQEAAKLSLDTLRGKIAEFEEHARITETERDQKTFILEGRIKKLFERLDTDLEQLKKAEIPNLVREVEKEFETEVARNLSSRELEKAMEEFVFGRIIAIFSNFRNQESEKIAAVLEKVYLDLAQRTNQTIEGIVRLASDIFQVLSPRSRN